MTIIQIIDAFTFYGVDVILLATATALLVQLLKVTLLKRIQKKMLTFAPFIIGTLLYAVYITVRHLDIFYVFNNYTDVLEHGLSVGALSTLVYVLYEQFVREKDNLSATEEVIKTLIEGYVPTEKTQAAAKQIAQAIEKDVTGNGAKRAAEILLDNAEENISERDVNLLAKLIIETLAHLAAS